MENLFNKSQHLIQSADVSFKRYLFKEISWKEKLIAIKGARGTGKTTLMLQHLKENTRENALYVSMDDIFFSENKLVDVAEYFVKHGGKFLFIDEVHKYPFWSKEVKNIYDVWKNDLHIVISGPSILEIDKSEADLSRRIVKYNLHEMSFREYMQLVHNIKIPVFPLEDILNNHIEISRKIVSQIKPLRFLKEFFKYGSYPFSYEGKNNFHEKLKSVINLIIETDLPAAASISYESIYKLKKLLLIISHSVPFKPNISELSVKIGTSRDHLLKYLNLLQRSRLISLLTMKTAPSGFLTKPKKIYLNNTAISYALNDNFPNIGSLRETFFLQHLSQQKEMYYSAKGDFMAGKYIFEIGGKDKSFNQIKKSENAFIAADDIEYGYGKKIPLWLFGFLY